MSHRWSAGDCGSVETDAIEREQLLLHVRAFSSCSNSRANIYGFPAFLRDARTLYFMWNLLILKCWWLIIKNLKPLCGPNETCLPNWNLGQPVGPVSGVCLLHWQRQQNPSSLDTGPSFPKNVVSEGSAQRILLTDLGKWSYNLPNDLPGQSPLDVTEKIKVPY